MSNHRLLEKHKHRYSADTAATSSIFSPPGIAVDGEEKTSRLKNALDRIAHQAMQRKKAKEADNTASARAVSQPADVA